MSAPSPAPSPRPRYGPIAMAFHWLTIPPIVGLLLGGTWLAGQPVAVRIDSAGAHATTGAVLLVLILVRLAWRITHPVAPPERYDVPRWQWALARAVHRGFYAVLIAQPLIGLAMALSAPYPVVVGEWLVLSDGGGDADRFALLAALHGWTAWLLMALIAVHLLAVLYHGFQGDGVNRRMLPLRRRVGAPY